MKHIHRCENCAHVEACDNIMKRYAGFSGIEEDAPACGHYAAKIEDVLGDTYDLDRMRELVEADKTGRCVVLPFPLHRMLLNTSDPYNPELMKDFRISATWTHCGIVFHSPWDIFLQNIEKGYIRLMREEAEAMLEGGTPDAEVD